jgi:hypothetical protein
MELLDPMTEVSMLRPEAGPKLWKQTIFSLPMSAIFGDRRMEDTSQ